MHLRSSTLLALALLASLAGCQRKPAGPPAPRSADTPAASTAARPAPAGVLLAYVWDCDGGRVLTMRNLLREDAIALDVHEGTRKLPHVRSADGAKYQDEEITFWSKGGSATFQRKGNPVVQCRENRAASLLADARVRGVRYRAQGNEPGWTLEIGPGAAMSWVTRYGQESHRYADVQSSGDEATGLQYTAQDPAGRLTVSLRRSACQDDMSGQAFDFAVTIEAGDGATYRGCGSKP